MAGGKKPRMLQALKEYQRACSKRGTQAGRLRTPSEPRLAPQQLVPLARQA